jgi:hypothetical protein
MSSLFSIRRSSAPWGAPGLAPAIARIADDILICVRAVDGALRAELDAVEIDLAATLRAHPNVRFPEQPYSCKDAHRRIRHDHDLLCVEAPYLAERIGQLAVTLSLPNAPVLSVPAFDPRSNPKRTPPKIDVQASCAAIVGEARQRGWTTFEDGSADVLSVASSLMGSPCPVGRALLALSMIQETSGRTTVRELADAVYFGGSRLRWIANHVGEVREAGSAAAPAVEAIVQRLNELHVSLQRLDAQIREFCLFDPTPRGRNSRDIVYQEVVSALALAGFNDAAIARLVVLKEPRDPGLWQRRVGEHVRNADQKPLGLPWVDRLSTSFRLGMQSRLKTWRQLS